ncbi:hypothetical protein Xvie_01765 [Xenorhabdus vietnamensis]|uniref:Uncharacterized protein n=1 Tax=Xenorhabdus vietnamensis TaxID=351656 RepID=A0A1Y2SFS7_9GAMM|nr:hypothetical protein Xvie_01765 [Xenorhabdus vietnamensis]
MKFQDNSSYAFKLKLFDAKNSNLMKDSQFKGV